MPVSRTSKYHRAILHIPLPSLCWLYAYDKTQISAEHQTQAGIAENMTILTRSVLVFDRIIRFRGPPYSSFHDLEALAYVQYIAE